MAKTYFHILGLGVASVHESSIWQLILLGLFNIVNINVLTKFY